MYFGLDAPFITNIKDAQQQPPIHHLFALEEVNILSTATRILAPLPQIHLQSI